MRVIDVGLDYLRLKITNDPDLLFIGRRLDYVDVQQRSFHGSKFVDLTGDNLRVISLFEHVPDVAAELARVFPVTRIDVYCDVEGDVLDKVKSDGTRISNGGRVETIYSVHLRDRGNVGVFGRVYDAKAAGHYDKASTRFECEFKREYARTMLTTTGWKVSPVSVLVSSVRRLFGVMLEIPGFIPIDWNAPRVRLEHSRERFYKRYGKGVLNDVETMGMQGFATFVRECVQDAKRSNDDAI